MLIIMILKKMKKQSNNILHLYIIYISNYNLYYKLIISLLIKFNE